MLTGWQLTVSKLFLIPQRYVVGLMGFFAVLNAYTMRVSLSLAITEMVVPLNKTKAESVDACPVFDTVNLHTVKDQDILYDWDEETQGLILGAFYWGYIMTHIPGGLLAERFGGKYSLGLGILCTAVLTLVTPSVIYLSAGDWKILCALRFFEGLGEGPTYPALNAMLAHWVPLEERARIGSLVYAGAQIGTIASNGLGGILIGQSGDWAYVFYVFGALGVTWYLIWQVLCYSTPQTHRWISDKESAYLEEQLAGGISKKRPSTPWKSIFTSKSVWALIAVQSGHDWGLFTMISDLPKYFKDVLKFHVEENGLWSSLPYMVMWFVSMSSGILCDWLIKKNYMSITFARKFFTTIDVFVASLGPAIFMVLASYSGCDRMLAVWMFTIAMGLMGFFYCGMKVNALDLAPNFAGTLMALVNGIGAIAGLISPYVTGVLTPNHKVSEWRTVFWIAFWVFNVTNVIYITWGSGKQQPWNQPKLDDEQL